MQMRSYRYYAADYKGTGPKSSTKQANRNPNLFFII